jgi:hypothetical protein
MLDTKLSAPGLSLLIVSVLAASCGEPQCPSGYVKKGDTCYRHRDAGVVDAGEDELDASEAELDASSSPAVASDGSIAAEGPRNAEPDTSSDATSDAQPGPAGDGSSDPCQGSGGAAVCLESALYHCSPQGVTESSETCASPQQCQLGIPGDRCAPCMPGKFQCKEARLERCANDGSGWELFMTCDSAALCNATAGACTDKACTATTRVCSGDTLNGCNASLTALAPIMTCDAGMCDQAQGECDVCVANAKECQGNVAVTCDANGRQATRSTCQGTTPRCTGSGRCVQCVDNTDCKGAHELCVDNRCEVQPYCGDGRVTSGEACDPQAPGENVWTCTPQCRRSTAYTWCGGNLTDAEGQPTQGIGCSTGEICFAGTCAGRCNTPGDCPTPAIGTVLCGTSPKVCVINSCKSAAECAPGLVCVPQTSGGGACYLCNDSFPCPTGTTCQRVSPNDTYRKCLP